MIKIIDKYNCCGCTACANVCSHNAITMTPDVMGFKYPIVDADLCVNCGLCDKVCQFHKEYQRYDNFSEPIVYGCRHKDINELAKSQSGAASWAIIQSFFSEPGVVYGAVFESPTNIIHKRAISLEECHGFRGSKYVQSDLRDTFRTVKADLNNGNRVLFFGTGCQISGLKTFIPGPLRNRLFIVDIVCHSVPSPEVWMSYINYLEQYRKHPIVNVNFRDKKLGWHSHNQTFVFSDNSILSETTYFSMYYQHMIIRPSCSNCHFTNLKRVSDITIGDFWGWEKYYKQWNDNKGVSLFLINSEKGLEMKRKAEQYLDFIESDTTKCLQPQLIGPVKLHPEYDAIVTLFEKKGFKGIARKYGYIPGYKYYKDKFMPYYYAGKHKIAKLIGFSK